MLKGKRAITDFSPRRYGKKSSPKLLDTVDERFSELRSLWMSRQGEAEGEVPPPWFIAWHHPEESGA